MKNLIDTQMPKGYDSMSDGTAYGGFYDSARSQLFNHVRKNGNITQEGLAIILYYHPVTGETHSKRPMGKPGERYRMCVLETFWDTWQDRFYRKYATRCDAKVVPIRPVAEPTGPMTITDAEARLFIAYLRDTANAIEARLG